jgi:hypothetical protein
VIAYVKDESANLNTLDKNYVLCSIDVTITMVSTEEIAMGLLKVKFSFL